MFQVYARPIGYRSLAPLWGHGEATQQPNARAEPAQNKHNKHREEP